MKDRLIFLANESQSYYIDGGSSLQSSSFRESLTIMRQEPPSWTDLAKDVERLGIAKACELHQIHRSTWYRRAGRTEAPKASKGVPNALREAVLQLSRERPSWGCDRIAYYLSVSGTPISSPTVQKILVAQGLGRRHQRNRNAQDPPRPAA